jgi:predicted porin
MKKIFVLTALAAAVVAPAFAQSSVTVYGRLNLTLESRKVGNVTDKSVYNNASRLGFKGVEDLGGGMKAGFQIEHGFNPATGQAAGTFWGRQAEVNLSGGFGMVRMGTFTSEAYFATADYVSMHNHDTGISSDVIYADANNFSGAKRVAYRTPSMGGATAELAVVDAYAGDRGYDLAANWVGGPLHLGAGYTKHGSSKAFAVRALYEMGAFTLGGYVQRTDDLGDDQVSQGAFGSRTAFRLAGMYTMGATELHLNFGRAGDTGGVADTGANQITAGVNYNLSKRTKVYGFYTKVNNQANAAYASGAAGADVSSLALGVRHNF